MVAHSVCISLQNRLANVRNNLDTRWFASTDNRLAGQTIHNSSTDHSGRLGVSGMRCRAHGHNAEKNGYEVRTSCHWSKSERVGLTPKLSCERSLSTLAMIECKYLMPCAQMLPLQALVCCSAR